MFEKEKEDWKENLSLEAAAELEDLLKKVQKHRCAYKQAPEVQIAQLWCALIEIRREIKELEQRLSRIEDLLNILFRGYEKQREELLKSLIRF